MINSPDEPASREDDPILHLSAPSEPPQPAVDLDDSRLQDALMEEKLSETPKADTPGLDPQPDPNF